MSATVQAILIGVGVAFLGGLGSLALWLVKTVSGLAAQKQRLAQPSTSPDPANGMTPHQQLIHNHKSTRGALDLQRAELIDLKERMREIEHRLDFEEKARWPAQDKAITEANAAQRDVERAMNALLRYLERVKD